MNDVDTYAVLVRTVPVDIGHLCCVLAVCGLFATRDVLLHVLEWGALVQSVVVRFHMETGPYIYVQLTHSTSYQYDTRYRVFWYCCSR